MDAGLAVGVGLPLPPALRTALGTAVPVAPAQLSPASGPPRAYLGTFLLAASFYAVTAHIAARYVLGDVPVRRAVLVGVVPAAVGLALQQYGPATVIAVSVVADYIAIRYVYRLSLRMAAGVSVVHYTVSAILGITLFNLIRLIGTMPG